jgi:uncharacterized OB-fold protein
MPEFEKQLPAVTESDRPFWEAAKRHELVAYKCANCGTFYSQVTSCIACDSPRMEWARVSGRGQVFTFCIFRQPFHPAWQNDIPYNVAYVKLDEGPLLISNIVGCTNDEIYVGMPVSVVFEDINEEITLPKFTPEKQ